MNLSYGEWLLFSIAGVLIMFVILYYVIKSAIRDALKKDTSDYSKPTQRVRSSEANSEKQRDLQQRYERGEITLEQYQKEWGNS